MRLRGGQGQLNAQSRLMLVMGGLLTAAMLTRLMLRMSDAACIPGAQVEYETLPGWQSDISNIRKWEDLPKAARDYVQRIEDLVSRACLPGQCNRASPPDRCLYTAAPAGGCVLQVDWSGARQGCDCGEATHGQVLSEHV
jgi:hypothetical protein